ncbi:MAG TPA: ABC transporter permease [Streptosporangiaceae bacterium]|nr:ABC transporter permease [Streptosporangiaceae bacterium]
MSITSAPGSGNSASGLAASTPAAAPPPPPGGQSRAHRLARLFSSNTTGLILLIAASSAVFSLLGTGYLGSFNLFSLSQQVAVDAVVGFSQLVMLAMARMNLAVTSIGAGVVMLSGTLMAHDGVPAVAALLAGLLAGAAVGWLMGWIEVHSRLSSFIVTLAFMSIYAGVMLAVTHGTEITTLPSSVGNFATAAIVVPQLSILLVVAAAAGVVLAVIYKLTPAGWKMLSVGENERAARLSGIQVSRIVIFGYVLSGVLAAVAGLMTMSLDASAIPSIGSTWLLTSFIGPVLGGAALSGGQVSVSGAFLGIVFYDSISSGLIVLHVSTYYLGLAQGVVLLGALMLDQLRRRVRLREQAQRSSLAAAEGGR